LRCSHCLSLAHRHFNSSNDFPYAVDINPTGRCYASGAEDGYVRLHHFDKSYLNMKDPVPEEDEVDEDDDLEEHDNLNAGNDENRPAEEENPAAQ
jgi:hypothetical protein